MRDSQGKRRAVLKSLISGLVQHGQIETTKARAASARILLEKLLCQAKKGTLPARRRVLAFLQDKKLTKKLVEEIAPKFVSRPSGFTRMIRLGQRRGDGAMMVKMEFGEGKLREVPVSVPSGVKRTNKISEGMKVSKS